MTRASATYMIPIRLWSAEVSHSDQSQPHRRVQVRSPATASAPSTTSPAAPVAMRALTVSSRDGAPSSGQNGRTDQSSRPKSASAVIASPPRGAQSSAASRASEPSPETRGGIAWPDVPRTSSKNPAGTPVAWIRPGGTAVTAEPASASPPTARARSALVPRAASAARKVSSNGTPSARTSSSHASQSASLTARTSNFCCQKPSPSYCVFCPPNVPGPSEARFSSVRMPPIA